jgi:phosphatidylglycerophosphate synthase
MQVVIAMPAAESADRLDSPVCGVPLIVRVIQTALRAGATRFLLLYPPELPGKRPRELFLWSLHNDACMEAVRLDHAFHPDQRGDWAEIRDLLDHQFLWMPCDYVTHRAALAQLLAHASALPESNVRFAGAVDVDKESHAFGRPVILTKRDLVEGRDLLFETVAWQGQPGISLRPPARLKEAEIELVRGTGKVTDGIYSRFNRRLCWPAVRWLSHTFVSPNAVSFGGLAIAILAGLAFAQGSWAYDVAGGLLFFVGGLFDEIDGMLARLKFRESALGCWLETWIDYSSYLLLFAGMMIGSYRRAGEFYLWLGAAVVVGCLISFGVISWQRKLGAPAGAPNEYYHRHLARLDRDARNPVSFATRNLHFLARRGVIIHYILLFAVLGGTRLFLILSALGANIAWIVTIYLSRRLYLSRRSPRRTEASEQAVLMEVGK